jgi:8-oxo-dGTP diphosphatase
MNVSAKAVIVKGDTFLLLKKGTTIKLPGGHVEKNETVEQALHREVREETKLDVRVLADLGSWENKAKHLKGRTFLCAVKAGRIRIDGTEHDAYAWVPFAALSVSRFPAWLVTTVTKAEKALRKNHG